tara:strand:- start:4185 stop:7181 length:2997 start_codon:yes stop_codon:yes gene_type:complete
MAVVKYSYPPQGPSGEGTFSDNIVGLQTVTGGGLTQGNFEFKTRTDEKVNRTFNTGTFSTPISLDGLGVNSVEQSRLIFENNFKVYPNYDLSQITNFTQYGSMVKRISVSIQNIINYFPAGIESTLMGIDYTTGVTAENIVYYPEFNETKVGLNVSRLRNPFGIDFSTNSSRNLEVKENEVSPLRNITTEYVKYSLYLNGEEYGLTSLIPTTSLTTGILEFYVQGNPFSGQSFSYDEIVVRPNDSEVNKSYSEYFDEVEKYLLNRNISPIYTATFETPRESDDGTFIISANQVTWPLYGNWNLDILTSRFETYLTELNNISREFDGYKTNLVSRFMITGSLKEFDTSDQKVEKTLQIYGRSFDESKKFIDALAYMNSVNYNTGNDIPSQLLRNLSQTLGWSNNISPITNDEFLNSVFGGVNDNDVQFAGLSNEKTPDELNYEYYRNLILNSGYLFKSKGTRKSIEYLMRLIGAPDALVEFNEYIYLADQKINVKDFDTQYAEISGGTYVSNTPILESGNTFSIMGVTYTGFTTSNTIQDSNVVIEEYPIDSEGYPKKPLIDGEYFFQKGAGWFESTPQHRSPEEVDLTNSVFSGTNPDFQTILQPFTYGQEYLNRYEQFPYMDINFNLRKEVDNNKSWSDTETGLRSNLDGRMNAKYFTQDDRLVLNVKNVDLFLNPAQGLVYDVWNMSNRYEYPIPNGNYISLPIRGGVDDTNVSSQPRGKTFFEFAQTFWINMINVRNRMYTSNGKTGGYPTLESVYWKYLESQENIGIENDNFNYQNMIDYVIGIGDYWVRLVEQMVPASTIWNSGIKYENSIFHRQKMVWRRQEGCQLIPVPCEPCYLVTNIFRNDCPIEELVCSTYPWNVDIQSFSALLGNVLTSYLTTNGYLLTDCVLNTLSTDWFVELYIDDVLVVERPFFNGVGYLNPTLSSPSTNVWDNALTQSLNDLKTFGYDYYYFEEPTDFVTSKVGVYNPICSISETGTNFKINVGININILCNQ